MSDIKQQKGKQGEDIAAEYLQRKGYTILARNVRFRAGELDIVARKGDTLVFAEVKARFSQRYGLGREAVDARKQRHIIAAANAYLLTHPACEWIRFDVLEVDLAQSQVTHLENVFMA